MKILGFDLGDGESCVTILDEDSTVEPRILPMQGRASLISAVGMKNGAVVIGEEASVLTGAQSVQVRFKSRYLTDEAAQNAVRAFAQGVMAELTKSDPLLMAQVCATVVGCPAGWGEGRRSRYAALMESAGFPNVSIVPEPRAAFLYARHARGVRIDPTLMKKSAMVIDIGSSTTDFAYIVDGRQQNLSVFGDTNLGGGLIDMLLLEEAIERSPDADALRRVMAESPAWRSYCELEARRLKERYFLSEEKWTERALTSSLIVCYDETLTLELAASGPIMAALVEKPIAQLGGRSFVGCLQDALRTAVLASGECPPQLVLLTGGASRMAFFQTACRAAFKDSAVVLCPEPECSIARGLAYAGRVDTQLAVFRQEIASIAHGAKLTAAVNANVHTLYAPIASALYEIVLAQTLETVALWRRGRIDTIEALEKTLQSDIASAFSGDALTKAIRKPLRVWLTALMGDLEEELTRLCMRCGVPPEQMSLEDARIRTDISGVRVSMIDAMGMDMLSGIAGVLLAVLGASLGGGSGVAMVAAGPAGMAIGAALGVLVALLGRNGMESMLRSVKLPILMRGMVRESSVRRGIERQRAEIEEQIVGALADPKNGFSAGLVNAVAGSLGVQLERMARDAEMSICA